MKRVLASRKNHIWAHNGGRFDWFPILGKYVEKGTTPSNVIISGNTIKEFRVGNVRFLDTKMFIPTALSKFTEIFDLVAKKGHFPHHFNLPENFGHVGDIPNIDQFDKRIRETVEFREWHAEWRARNARGEKWSFWKELVDYCEGDVLLLRTGFEKFSYEIKELTGLQPAYVIALLPVLPIKRGEKNLSIGERSASYQRRVMPKIFNRELLCNI